MGAEADWLADRTLRRLATILTTTIAGGIVTVQLAVILIALGRGKMDPRPVSQDGSKALTMLDLAVPWWLQCLAAVCLLGALYIVRGNREPTQTYAQMLPQSPGGQV